MEFKENCYYIVHFSSPWCGEDEKFLCYCENEDFLESAIHDEFGEWAYNVCSDDRCVSPYDYETDEEYYNAVDDFIGECDYSIDKITTEEEFKREFNFYGEIQIIES